MGILGGGRFFMGEVPLYPQGFDNRSISLKVCAEETRGVFHHREIWNIDKTVTYKTVEPRHI